MNRWNLMLCGVLVLAGPAHAQGSFDGEWAGTTSQGLEIVFTIEDDVITDIFWDADLSCRRSGETIDGAYAILGDQPISPDGTFEYLKDVTGRIPEPGTSSFYRVTGRLSSSDAQGKLTRGKPVYLGTGTRTEACDVATSWTAQWVGPVEAGEDSLPLARGSAFAGPGLFDGEWAGEVDGGGQISFTVEGDNIISWNILSIYNCPRSGHEVTSSRTGSLTLPIDPDGNVEFSRGAGSDGRPLQLEASFYVWEGTFDSPDSISGTLTDGWGLFVGVGIQTESCHIRSRQWSAVRVTP